MDASHDIQSEVKKYLLVFYSLMFLTVVTVAISYLHVETHLAVTLALIVATIKGSLVCCYFMHLISEKKLIKIFLLFVVFFFISMIYLIVEGYYDTPQGTTFYDKTHVIAQETMEGHGGEHHQAHDGGH